MQKVKVQAPPQGARIISTSGACIQLDPNEIREIPLGRAHAFSQAGCFVHAPANSAASAYAEPAPAPAAPPADLRAVIELMIEEGLPESFTTLGEPRQRVVTERLGEPVSRADVIAMFETIMSERADNADDTDPDAEVG
ncbi:MAG TPA: hypothetical protein VLA11_04865 [Woeseiaceae bacterium]|nr:hypothetical protein [Woeseiaceae bacterium]